jgi:hypothetical protein
MEKLYPQAIQGSVSEQWRPDSNSVWRKKRSGRSNLDDIGAAECEPRLQCRREARERIDNRKHAKLAPGGELIVNEVHRPGLVRSRCRSTVIPQLGLDSALRRFVTQLQA